MIKKAGKKLQQNFEKFQRNTEKLFTNLALAIIYFLGIGPSAILAKIFGKKFLNCNEQNTSWHKRAKNLIKHGEKMY